MQPKKAIKKISIFVVICSFLYTANIIFHNRKKNIKIEVESPYNCSYQIIIKSNQVYVSNNKGVHYNILISEKRLLVLDSLISIIISKGKDLEYRVGKDSYSYALYKDDFLIRKTAHDFEDFYVIINLLRKYINIQELSCCDFFYIFDEITKEAKDKENQHIYLDIKD